MAANAMSMTRIGRHRGRSITRSMFEALLITAEPPCDSHASPLPTGGDRRNGSISGVLCPIDGVSADTRPAARTNVRGLGGPPPRAEGLDRGRSISIALDLDDVEEARRCFDALSASGKVIQPLIAAPWGALFGVVHDELGISWMFNCATKPA
jgi:hypothetical protein